MLPIDLINLIKKYLNNNNILIFDDLVEAYNQDRFSTGYDLAEAEKIKDVDNNKFKHNKLQSAFTIEILNNEQGEPNEENVIVQFNYDDVYFVNCFAA